MGQRSGDHAHLDGDEDADAESDDERNQVDFWKSEENLEIKTDSEAGGQAGGQADRQRKNQTNKQTVRAVSDLDP